MTSHLGSVLGAAVVGASILTPSPARAAPVVTPLVISVTPDTGQGARHRLVAVDGDGFAPGAKLSFPGVGVTVEVTTFVTVTRLTALIDLARNAPIGLRGATVTDPGGSSATCESCFNVLPAPRPTAASPGSAEPGKHLTVHITGSGFNTDDAVSFGPGTRVDGVQLGPDHTLIATVVVARDARPGTRAVTVVDGRSQGVGTCGSCFMIKN